MSSTPRWQQLPQDEKHLLSGISDEPEDIASSSLPLANRSSRDEKPSSRSWLLLSGLALLCSTVLNIVLALQSYGRNLDALCTRQTTLHWSPILEQPMKYSDIRFNGSLFRSGIYRQPPSPEVDQKWLDLGLNLRPQVLPAEQAERAGLTLDQAKRLDSQGGGYYVEVEAIHHLHCLASHHSLVPKSRRQLTGVQNVLRQNIWFNAEYYRQRRMGVWANTEAIVRLHVGHCIDILRQQLMCTADTGLFGQMWANTTSMRTFADFSTHHKCKDFDAVKKWAIENQAGETDVAAYHEGDLVIDRYP